MGQHESAIWPRQFHLTREQKFDPAGFEKGGKDRIIDVTLPIRVAIAQFLS